MITHKLTPQYLLTLLIFGISLTQAQEPAAETNSLKAGAWALQFGISSNFTLLSFQGTTVSAKYQTSTTNAWRVGISINGNDQNITGLQSPIQGDTFTSSGSNNSSNGYENILLRVQYLWYANSEGVTHFYIGAGPIVGYSRNHYDQQDISNSSSPTYASWLNQTRSSTVRSWSAGASAVVGVEYFPVRVFSLHAEYSSNLTYEQSKNESNARSVDNYGTLYTNGDNATGSSHQWTLGNGGIYFGLSLYF